MTSGDALRLLTDAGVWCMPVQSLTKAVSHPQVLENDMIQSNGDPSVGTVRAMGVPVTRSLRRFPGRPV